MAPHAGSEGTVKIGANAVAEIRSFSLEESCEVIEDTTMGDTARSYIAGLKSYSGTLSCYWDETDTNGQQAIDIGSALTINWYPEGADSGDLYYTGSVIVVSKSVSSSFDGMVEAEYGVTGNGALSEATV